MTTGGFQDVTGTVTGPVTPTGPLTSQQAIQLAQAAAGFSLGQPGVPCATFFGQVCQVVGAVAGIGIVTGDFPGGPLPGPGLPPAPPGPVPGIGPGFGPWADMSWNLTANAPAPAGTAAGTPFAVFNTTSGLEAFPCVAVSGGAASATCVVTTTGIAFEGSSVAVVFPGTGGVALGAVHGQIVVSFPPGPPPPPPLELIAPPPPPIAGPGPGFPGFPEVPVIPEADSLFLLAGGLALVGGLAGWAALRRRSE